MSVRPTRIISSAFCLTLLIIAYFYGPALAAFTYVKWHFRNSPQIWLVPKPLALDLTSRAAGPKQDYFGFQFTSPTNEVREVKRFKSAVVLSFSDCANMSIIKPNPAGELVHVMRQEASKRGRNIQDVFGQKATRSDFGLRSTILNVTPSDLHLFSSPQEIAANSVLLVLKGAELQQFKHGLYSFTTGWMHGFQEGDLLHDRGVVIEAFDEEDRCLTLVVAARPGTTCFGQPELNEILSSLRPAPTR